MCPLLFLIFSLLSTGNRDPGLECGQPSQRCLRTVGQRGQEPVQSWLWGNGEQTSSMNLMLMLPHTDGFTQKISCQLAFVSNRGAEALSFTARPLWETRSQREYGTIVQAAGRGRYLHDKGNLFLLLYKGTRWTWRSTLERGDILLGMSWAQLHTRSRWKACPSLVQTASSFLWKRPIGFLSCITDLSFVILIDWKEGRWHLPLD